MTEYIRKIIQIPFQLPGWDKSDIKDIIQNLIDTGKVDSGYLELVKDNTKLISKVVEPVLREVKRFIDSFLISYRIYSKIPGVKPKEMILVQALRFRWHDFYKVFSSNEEFRKMIDVLLPIDFSQFSIVLDEKEFENFRRGPEDSLSKMYNDEKEKRRKELEGIDFYKKNEELERAMRKIEVELGDAMNLFIDAGNKLRKEYKPAAADLDRELWFLLREEHDTIFGIPNWEIYRRATEVTKEISSTHVSKTLTGKYNIEGSEAPSQAGDVQSQVNSLLENSYKIERLRQDTAEDEKH